MAKPENEPPSLCIRQTSIFRPSFPSFPIDKDDELGFAVLDLLNPTLNPFAHHLPSQCFLPPSSSHFDFFDSVTDLIQIEKSKRVQERKDSSYLKTLCDRVSALETDLDRVVKEKKTAKKKKKDVADLDRVVRVLASGKKKEERIRGGGNGEEAGQEQQGFFVEKTQREDFCKTQREDFCKTQREDFLKIKQKLIKSRPSFCKTQREVADECIREVNYGDFEYVKESEFEETVEEESELEETKEEYMIRSNFYRRQKEAEAEGKKITLAREF